MDMQEVKTEADEYGGAPRPWNEPKIPMQQTKSGREKLEEVVGTLKVVQIIQSLVNRSEDAKHNSKYNKKATIVTCNISTK